MSPFKNKQLLALSLGHFGTDMYPNILPIMYPLLMGSLGLSYTLIGILQLCYTLVSSLSQPFFGYMSDRFGARYFAAGGVLAVSVFTGLLGFAWDFPSLLIVLCLAAIGVATFHPQGAMNTAAVTRGDQRALAMSIYMLGGNIGFGIGPVVGAVLLSSPWGLHSTALLVVPGALIALWLTRLMVKVDQAKQARASTVVKSSAAHPQRGAIMALSVVIGIVMLRSWASQSLGNFLPLYFRDRGIGTGDASILLFVMLMAAAAGGISGGFSADRVGRVRVVALSLILATPGLLGILLTSNQWTPLFMIVVGMALGSSSSVTLVMAQEILPRSMGVVSGLILGLAFVTGGIGAMVTGILADHYGLATAIDSLVIVPACGALLCLLLPKLLRRAEMLRPIEAVG